MSLYRTAAIKIAEYIVTQACEKGDPVSNLKLQKLLYYVQGEALKTHGESAFDESIEAWNYGPVVRSVYEKFRIFGAGPIFRKYETPSITGDIKDVIDSVIDTYGELSAWQLVQETHKPDTPWSMTMEKGQLTISMRSMREFFCK